MSSNPARHSVLNTGAPGAFCQTEVHVVICRLLSLIDPEAWSFVDLGNQGTWNSVFMFT